MTRFIIMGKKNLDGIVKDLTDLLVKKMYHEKRLIINIILLSQKI